MGGKNTCDGGEGDAFVRGGIEVGEVERAVPAGDEGGGWVLFDSVDVDEGTTDDSYGDWSDRFGRDGGRRRVLLGDVTSLLLLDG